MTEKEMYAKNAREHGMEVMEIGNTLQWVMKSGQLCIQYFTEDGAWIKSEWV